MAKTIIRSNQYLEAPIVDPKHLVNKEYIDNLLNRHMKEACRAATTFDISSEYTLLDKTLVGLTPGELILDGVSVEADDRVLIKNQTDGSQNGIYRVVSKGSEIDPFELERAEDFNNTSDITKNLFIRVSEGLEQADLLFQLTNDDKVVLDSTSLVFQKYSSSNDNVAEKVIMHIKGDGLEKEFILTHNLGSEDLMVGMKAGKNTILAQWECFSEDAITVSFDSPLESDYELRVTITG